MYHDLRSTPHSFNYEVTTDHRVLAESDIDPRCIDPEQCHCRSWNIVASTNSPPRNSSHKKSPISRFTPHFTLTQNQHSPSIFTISIFYNQNVHNSKPRRPPTRRLRHRPQPPHPRRNNPLPHHRHRRNNPNPHGQLATLPHRPQTIPALALHPTARIRRRHLGRAAPPAPVHAGAGQFREMLFLRVDFEGCGGVDGCEVGFWG